MAQARFTCDACGADLVWDPAQGQLKCSACGKLQTVAAAGGDAAAKAIAEQCFDAALRAQQPITPGALEVKCDGCGAVFNFEPPQVAGACPFCAARIVAQPKAASPLVSPSALLPFRTPVEGARGLVQSWIGGLWFAPSALQKMAQLDALRGVYLPHWSYSAATRTRYAGERGDRYTELVTTTNAQGQRVQQTVVRVRWRAVQGIVEGPLRDVLVVATQVVDERVTALEPWDLESLTAYEPAYLAGFQAQRYQIDLPAGFELAKQRMQPVIEGWIRADIGGDEQRIHARDTRYDDVAFRHILLPVWIGAYRFKGRVFQIAVNARTGEVQGDRPYSALKITLLILAIFLVILVLAQASRR
ncbi:MAG: hypothetical protein K2X03_06710 [Bryobacteraceae bacterium]|nr:hypothetical protein [Bryobacteraceae bacterium]